MPSLRPNLASVSGQSLPCAVAQPQDLREPTRRATPRALGSSNCPIDSVVAAHSVQNVALSGDFLWCTAPAASVRAQVPALRAQPESFLAAGFRHSDPSTRMVLPAPSEPPPDGIGPESPRPFRAESGHLVESVHTSALAMKHSQASSPRTASRPPGTSSACAMPWRLLAETALNPGRAHARAPRIAGHGDGGLRDTSHNEGGAPFVVCRRALR
jgi:hypothetical protein